jgi:hypothetical protein
MTLVREEDVLDRHVTGFQVFDDLLGLDDRHVGVVCAMLHHRGGADAIQLPSGDLRSAAAARPLDAKQPAEVAGCQRSLPFVS